MSKRLFTEKLFEMEKNAFLLDVIQARACAIIQADSQSNSLSETALVLGVNTAYIEFVLKMRDNNPGVDFESLCQLIYDKIYEEDWKRTSRFKEFDINLLRLWCDLKVREKELREGHIALDSILSDAKHAYYSVHGKDIEWYEIQEKSEQNQQETEPDDEDDTQEMITHINRQEAQDELVCRMFREGAISEETAIKYVGGDLEHNSFMKLVSLYTDEESEPETEETPFDFFEYHKKETEARMICKMYREGIIDEAVALEYLDEPEWSHDTFQRVVDTFAEKEKEEKQDDKQ